MKQLIASLMACCLTVCPSLMAQESAQTSSNPPATSSPQSAPQTDGKMVLQDGTPVRMRINRTVSSADARVGDQVDFEVLDAVKVGDFVVIPQGGVALATVTEAQAKRRMGRAGKLNINIDSVRLFNGDKAPLRAVKEVKGGGHVGAMTGAIVATSIVFFPAAPLFLFMHGKDITIPQGTEITAYINGDIAIAPPKPAPAAQVTPPAATAVAQTADLDIVSTPDGADIEIDGNYSGSTPSKISVTPGEHTITIKKDGFKPWERRLKASTGDITVKADLQKVE